ncbi:MAG: nickel-responsive transcriptional regulator NikR [Thermoplasmata archaeon]
MNHHKKEKREKVVRFGVSFDEELLSKFDGLISKKGYQSRSEAIRDLVREALIEKGIAENEEIVGTITLIYDHDFPGVVEKLMHIQHIHHDEITSTTHTHIDPHRCLEVLVVRGRASKLHKLADNLKAIKGVLNGQLVASTIKI